MFFSSADATDHGLTVGHIDMQAFKDNLTDFADCAKKTYKLCFLLGAWWFAYDLRCFGSLSWICVVACLSATRVSFQSAQNVWVNPERRQSDTHTRGFLAQSMMHGLGIMAAMTCIAISKGTVGEEQWRDQWIAGRSSQAGLVTDPTLVLGFDALSYADLVIVPWAVVTLAVGQRVVFCGVRWRPAWKTDADGSTRRPAGGAWELWPPTDVVERIEKANVLTVLMEGAEGWGELDPG
jgi:hypothetical protein